MDWLRSKQGKADRIQDDNEEIERKISAFECNFRFIKIYSKEKFWHLKNSTK